MNISFSNIIKSLLILIISFLGTSLMAQDAENRLIQFNGVVLGEDSLDVPGVHVYVPKGKRGTTTNMYGFFTMPVMEEDSVVISAIGYKKLHYKIPKTQRDNITKIFQLEIDTAYLEEVEIYPFPPTAQAFKEAILAMQLPSEYRHIESSLDPEEIQRLARELPNDSYANQRYYVQQQARQWQYMYGAQPNQLLNPFAWNQLIKSIKRGDLKDSD